MKACCLKGAVRWQRWECWCQEQKELAHEVLEEAFSGIRDNVILVWKTDTVNAVNEARRAAVDGADILIMRGYQALLVKEYTPPPWWRDAFRSGRLAS